MRAEGCTVFAGLAVLSDFVFVVFDVGELGRDAFALAAPCGDVFLFAGRVSSISASAMTVVAAPSMVPPMRFCASPASNFLPTSRRSFSSRN